MSEDYTEEQAASSQNQIGLDDESYKVRPPSKKKFEEEMEKLVSQIKEKEAELERMKASGSVNVSSELKNLKAEKSAAITKRKQIDAELEKLKKIIPEKMRQLGQLESSLIYKSEEKINTAIQRLEWNLKVQPFKLMEEKKIVSEIDRLKRSKKTLVQYLALKQEISAIRDTQRCMREERDMYFQAVGKLNSNEDRLRRDSISAKTMLSVLKLQIDELYESKRQLVANHKRQMEEYQGAREKQRKGSWKKREVYRKSAVSERRKQQAELEVEKTPYEKYISWCNSLIKVMSRYNSLATQEPSLDSLSPASSMEEPEPAEEIDDGQYVLLKKSDDGLEHSVGTRRPSKKNRRPRKQSSIKKVTLSPDMVHQLTELGLKAPNSVSEVTEAIESLRLKKALLEQEQQISEVASDAGISATESLICEMSRQASKTESYEGAVDTNPGELVYAEILHGCREDHSDHPEGWEVEGAIGGCEEHTGILSPNSDSTVEGDTGSSESHSSVCENPESSRRNCGKPAEVVFRAEESKERMLVKKTEHGHELVIMKAIDQPTLSHINVLPQGKIILSDVDSSSRQNCRPSENLDFLSKPQSREHLQVVDQSKKGEKPASLNIFPLSFPTKQLVTSSASSQAFPTLVTTVPPVASLSQTGNSSLWNSSAEPLRSAKKVSSFPPTPSPTQSHGTLAARLSHSFSSAGVIGQVQQTLAVPACQSLPALVFNSEEFPSLSQSISQARRGSNLSTRSSGSSAYQEQLLHSCDQHPGTHTASQITSFDKSSQPYSQTVFHPHQSHQPQVIPVNEELCDSHVIPPKFPGALSHSDKLLPMSQIPSLDKSSTEKWVESSVAYVKELIPDQCEDDVTAALTESTRL